MREKLSGTQLYTLGRLEKGVIYSAYSAGITLATMRALVRKGYIKAVTPRGLDSIFSPRIYFQFTLVD